MKTIEELSHEVLSIAEAIRSGEADPIDFQLSKPYRDLKEVIAEVESRVDVDEILNEVLGTKVDRVQELARVLAAPELYVSKLKEINPRRLGAMVRYFQPVVLTRLNHESLERSKERIDKLMDAMTREHPADPIPTMSGIPNDFRFETEDSIFLGDLWTFADTIKKGAKFSVDDVIMSEDFDAFLKKFLYIVILVSKGVLSYDAKTGSVEKID